MAFKHSSQKFHTNGSIVKFCQSKQKHQKIQIVYNKMAELEFNTFWQVWLMKTNTFIFLILSLIQAVTHCDTP